MEQQVRSFIAIELPDYVKRGLAGLIARLQAAGPLGVKWVDVGGIHLTLKFLGNVAAGRIDEIASAIAAAARGIPPFRLEVTQPGAFPDLRRVQVVWVGLGGEVGKVAELQRRIEAEVTPLGFPTEGRPFVPHLTLARVGREAILRERQQLGELIAGARVEGSLSIPVEQVSLMRSVLARGGAVYSQLSAARLAG